MVNVHPNRKKIFIGSSICDYCLLIFLYQKILHEPRFMHNQKFIQVMVVGGFLEVEDWVVDKIGFFS